MNRCHVSFEERLLMPVSTADNPSFAYEPVDVDVVEIERQALAKPVQPRAQHRPRRRPPAAVPRDSSERRRTTSRWGPYPCRGHN